MDIGDSVTTQAGSLLWTLEEIGRLVSKAATHGDPEEHRPPDPAAFRDRRVFRLPAGTGPGRTWCWRRRSASSRERRAGAHAAHRRSRRPGGRALQPQMVDDAMTHPRFKYFREAGEDPYHSFLGVPLVDRGLLQGVLVVQTSTRASFGPDAVRMLVTAGTQLAPVVSEARTLASSSRRPISGWARWLRTSGGVGTPTRRACSANSTPCCGASSTTTRLRCSAHPDRRWRSAPRRWCCTAGSTTPIAGCRST